VRPLDRLRRDVCVRTLPVSGCGRCRWCVGPDHGTADSALPLGMVSGYLGRGGPRREFLVLLMDTRYTLPVCLLSVWCSALPCWGAGPSNAAAAAVVV